MIGRPLPRPNIGLLGEYALLAAVLASDWWVIHFFIDHRYLPQPFVFNTFDTFMDWFNTAGFANAPGAYDVWHAVYPPLSFVFLRIFSVHSCYGDSINARNCDWIGIATILTFYVVDCVLAFVAFRRIDRSTAIPRGLAFAFGLPLLFCLERGNLIVVCLALFILAYGGIVRSRFWRALAIALTINFKPYLVVSSLALGVKREWRWLEAAALLSVATYLVTLILFGSGDPMQIIANMGLWVNFTNGQFWEQTYFSTSYSTLLLVKDSTFPILDYVSSDLVDTLVWLVPLVIHLTQLAALAGIVAAWLQPQAVPLARVTALFAGLHLVTQSPGGYALTFLVFLVFLEAERRPGQSIALFCAYALSVLYDRILASVVNTDTLSWLSGVTVQVDFGLAAGQMLRPGLVIILVWALAYDTVTQAILAHHRQRPSLGLMPA